MKKLEDNLRKVCASMRKDRDFTIAITGRKRRGKSTLAYHISEYVSAIFGSKIWLCYNYEQLRHAMEHSKRYDVIFADEAISFLNKYQWNHPDATEFITLYDMMGYKRLFIILVMPAFQQFIKGFRNDRLNTHIWIPERGRAALYPVEESKNGCYFPDSPAITDNFPPLPKDKEAEYRKIKEAAVMGELEKVRQPERKTVIDFRKFVNEKLKEKFPDLTQEERSEFLGVTRQAVTKIERNLDIENGKKETMKLAASLYSIL